MEGRFEGRTLEQVLKTGSKSTQRAEVKKHKDNLKIEGEFTGKDLFFTSKIPKKYYYRFDQSVDNIIYLFFNKNIS